MKQQQDLSCKLLQELAIWKSKIEELEELVNSRSSGMPVRDLAKRAGKIFKNGLNKVEAIEKMASKERR